METSSFKLGHQRSYLYFPVSLEDTDTAFKTQWGFGPRKWTMPKISARIMSIYH
jgi:hypothetical protein